MAIIGPREAVFHHMPCVEQFASTADFIEYLLPCMKSHIFQPEGNKTMSKIIPTIGRVIWYRPGAADLHPSLHGRDEGKMHIIHDKGSAHTTELYLRALEGPPMQPLRADVIGVVSDDYVNLQITDAEGHTFTRFAVQLMQGEGMPVHGHTDGYAEWMPYQLSKK